ncbi:hypothetical protein ET445_13810 [Agromyces protaetiae]|uniref:Uncharacterized protein n=1 Tax=Agromyces protaetiae TaxID=2509455 RepID=A0A4P6FDF5_9MICO|nr:hypothetical protein [Agromyces protaetiae]QAY74240.1 hypothetical protein ET445_13810 [Agromyces protaetiae]
MTDEIVEVLDELLSKARAEWPNEPIGYRAQLNKRVQDDRYGFFHLIEALPRLRERHEFNLLDPFSPAPDEVRFTARLDVSRSEDHLEGDQLVLVVARDIRHEE